MLPTLLILLALLAVAAPADFGKGLAQQTKLEQVAEIRLPDEVQGSRISQLFVSPHGDRVALIIRVNDPEPVDRLVLYAVTDDKATLLPSPVPAVEMPEIVAFDDGGTRMLISSTTGDMQRTTRVWDTTTGGEVFREGSGPYSPRPLAFAADGEHLVRPAAGR